MELIVLGSDGTWPRAGGASSGYLLRHEGSAVWVDAGTGTLSNLQRHVGVFEVDALVLSHAHQDHVLDLFPFFYARWLSSEGPPAAPLPVFAPPGLLERAAGMMTDVARERLGLVFESRPVEAGETFEAGAFTIRTAPMRHYLPTLGMRAEAGGAAFAYSADTAPTDELVSLAAGADVLVAEATLTERGDPGVLHLSAAEAGEHAAAAGVGRLVLSHLRNERDRACERAAGGFGGRIDVAEEGMVVTT